ncbi:MAG: hypothetical protein VR70_06920 [Rhodospirillaceae bacterium BRH_c57]|nr:MAG: hypothetical protein VR70_06920 [Rhodospirillaceae bacterium BRH_c57]
MKSLKMFNEAHAAANKWLTDFHGRSQAALWEVLAMTYGGYREAILEPEALEEAAVSQEIRVRKDAPYRVATIVLKIVFRPQPNHGLGSAFAGWAKVLGWLDQQGIEPNLAARMIGDNGGVHGVCKLFNKENRKTKAGDLKAVATAKIAKAVEVFPRLGTVNRTADGTVLTISTGKDVKTLEALGQQPGYVLLVARVGEDFELSDLRIIDRDEEKISGLVVSRSRAMTTANAAATANDNDTKKEAV